MTADLNASDHEGGRTFLVRLAPNRVAELDRLAKDLQKDASELAREFLEAEIEAQHGLSYGPWQRKYMYR
jgi:hypothetical protein